MSCAHNTIKSWRRTIDDRSDLTLLELQAIGEFVRPFTLLSPFQSIYFNWKKAETTNLWMWICQIFWWEGCRSLSERQRLFHGRAVERLSNGKRKMMGRNASPIGITSKRHPSDFTRVLFRVWLFLGNSANFDKSGCWEPCITGFVDWKFNWTITLIKETPFVSGSWFNRLYNCPPCVFNCYVI